MIADLGLKTKEKPSKVNEEKQAVVLADDDNAIDEAALAALMDVSDRDVYLIFVLTYFNFLFYVG